MFKAPCLISKAEAFTLKFKQIKQLQQLNKYILACVHSDGVGLGSGVDKHIVVEETEGNFVSASRCSHVGAGNEGRCVLIKADVDLVEL